MDEEINANSSESKNIEVLNVNNVDSTGGFVLNDEKLLELVQLYPFLYNPRVRPFQDSDYDDWAWNRITSAFNQNYVGLLPPVIFDKIELQRRWEKLKPIIKKMAKMLDLTAIPEPLRQMIVKISIQLEDQVTDVRINLPSDAQQIIYANMEMVGRLPLEKRLQLEAEIMDFILNAELDNKATIKLTGWNAAVANDEYEALLNAMDMKELLLLKSTEQIDTTDNSQEQTVTSTTSNGVYEIISMNGDSSSDMMYESGNDVDFEAAMGSGTQIYKRKTFNSRKRLQHQWIDLQDADKFVKRVVVRLKRINLEDYIPLSQIKRQRRNSMRF
ncbi:uncharacterized protein Lhr [Eurosta solidaginis]|uniref:uncharacterized protein Lhr n=1 Tax=Eurosta solidaginis TaxID=178769 RepID=UPI0035309875